MGDESEGVRARALAHARVRETHAPRAQRTVAISVALLLHLIAAVCLYLLMRPHPISDEGRIEVRLLEAAPSEPSLPEPPMRTIVAVPMPTRLPMPATTSPGGMANATPSEETLPTSISSAQLFRADGSVRLAPAVRPTPHEEGMQRGRELMARGHNVLHCTEALSGDGGHHESLGDEVARKYLSWIGLYGAHAAQKLQTRLAAAAAACDDAIHKRPSGQAADDK